MPKRTDISSILVIGAGPIVIGQACEFDYSGTQAIKALKEEGYRVVLVNSNPATIMTDPETADITYIDPLTVESLTEIIRRERPDALLRVLRAAFRVWRRRGGGLRRLPGAAAGLRPRRARGTGRGRGSTCPWQVSPRR